MRSKDDAVGKRVLVVDAHPKAQEIRTLCLGERGVTVDTVPTIEDARSRLSIDDTYDLVLLAAQENPEEAIIFRQELRDHYPKQRVAFLVGPPHYVALKLGKNPPKIEPQSSDSTEEPKDRAASA